MSIFGNSNKDFELPKGMSFAEFDKIVSDNVPKCWEYLQQNAVEGDLTSIINAIDKFGWANTPMTNLGDVKGDQVDLELDQLKPKILVDIGTYAGYGVLRFARKMQQVSDEGAHIYTFEENPAFAEVAAKIINYAGVGNMVTIIVGKFAEAIDKLKNDYGVETTDVLFVDHNKDEYLSDLQVAETKGLLRKGSVVIADNVVVLDMSTYLTYVRTSGKFESRLIKSVVEYLEPPMEDGIEISVFKGDA